MGSVTGASDETGTLVMRQDYDAFGNPHDALLPGLTGPRFTGKDWDEEAGLYYFNARWYDPELGRFITEDPIRDGVNWYGYVNNRPLDLVDPSGLAVVDENGDFEVGNGPKPIRELPEGNLLIDEERAKKLEYMTNHARKEPEEGAGEVITVSYFNQNQFNEEAGFSQDFANHACFATSILNELSEQYTLMTGKSLTFEQALTMMTNATQYSIGNESTTIDSGTAWVGDSGKAATAMWSVLNIGGSWTREVKEGYVATNIHSVYQLDNGVHFVNSYTGGYGDSSSHSFEVVDGSVRNITKGRDGKTRTGGMNREITLTILLVYTPLANGIKE